MNVTNEMTRRSFFEATLAEAALPALGVEADTVRIPFSRM
jgi:hypothetical protein